MANYKFLNRYTKHPGREDIHNREERNNSNYINDWKVTEDSAKGYYTVTLEIRCEETTYLEIKRAQTKGFFGVLN